jgi:hypothetical protein
MAIAPIDLQTLFSQLDKVAKTQTSQREGQAIHQAVQGAQVQRKTEVQIQQVNEAQDMGEGAEKVKDRASGHSREQADGKNKKRSQDDEAEKDKSIVFSDPSLGKNIDISL